MTVARETAIEGGLVRLRAQTEGDLPVLVRWLSDPDVRHWLHMSETPLPTLENVTQRSQMMDADPARRTWTIETHDGRPVGTIGLIGMNDVHGRAELAISIGEKDCWSRGYGTDAIRALLRHAFYELGVRRVTLITDVDNERGIRAYEKAGFRREGILRGHRLRYGQPLDMLTMGVLRDEWR